MLKPNAQTPHTRSQIKRRTPRTKTFGKWLIEALWRGAVSGTLFLIGLMIVNGEFASAIAAPFFGAIFGPVLAVIFGTPVFAFVALMNRRSPKPTAVTATIVGSWFWFLGL